MSPERVTPINEESERRIARFLPACVKVCGFVSANDPEKNIKNQEKIAASLTLRQTYIEELRTANINRVRDDLRDAVVTGVKIGWPEGSPQHTIVKQRIDAAATDEQKKAVVRGFITKNVPEETEADVLEKVFGVKPEEPAVAVEVEQQPTTDSQNPDFAALEMLLLNQQNMGAGGESAVGRGKMTPELLRRMATELRLDSLEKDRAKRWVVAIINTFTRGNSLFFSGGWPQAVQFAEQMLQGLEETTYNKGDRKAIEKARDVKKMVGAMLNVAIQRESISHSDSTLEKYLNSVVPVDAMEKGNPFVWDKEARQAVLDFDPLIKKIYKDILDKAYDVNDGGKRIKLVRNYLSDIEGTTERFMSRLSADPDMVRAVEKGGGLYYARTLVKTAIDLFAVDDGPGWVATVNEYARDRKLSWLKREDVYKEKRARTGVEGNVKVYSPLSNLQTEEGEGENKKKIAIAIEHPVFSVLADPVGVQRFKGVYGEDVLKPMERGLQVIIKHKWTREVDKNEELVFRIENGQKVDIKKPYPRVSNMNWKDLGRMNKVLNFALGNPHGDKIESIDPRDVEPMVENIKNMFNTDHGKREVTGLGVGLILASKIEAALTGSPDDAITNLWRTTAIIFGVGSQEQLNRELEAFYGKGLSGEVGLLRAQIDRLGINLEVPEFKDALVKASTSTRDIDKARGVRTAQLSIAGSKVLQTGLELVATMFGIKLK